MSEISKTYEPQSVEDKWYQFWLDGKFFVANEKSAKPAYSIVIPPPNVTGVLTLGHVLNNTIQDILARKARMDGKEVLWLPGTDHAGIATQTVVERALKKEGKIKHRDDVGREKFLEEVWKWKNEKGGIIIQQLKKLGASCDWTRERFTMDPEYSRCVQRVFVDLYKKGLIYRGKRMVNWCPASLTALSDEEVVMKEQKGFLYYFKVEVAEAPGTFLTIATTRPETIPGDTAVAVNPKDPRYAHLIGKHVVRPLPAELPREQKLIPIIGDEHVDFEFGTGVLKVTPAHDKADFEIGQRHNLPAIEVIAANGVMNDAAGPDLRGLDRFKARKVAVEKLTELGALEKEEPYTNNVGYSERADVPIEPRLSEQWFLKYPSVEKARNCVEQEDCSGAVSAPNSAVTDHRYSKMQFHPQRWAKVYDHWMGGLQDWCVSRQLWWGHRIPVWSLHFNKQDFRKLDVSVINNVETICKFAGTETPDGLVSNLISTSKIPKVSNVEEISVGNMQHPERVAHFRLIRNPNGNDFELHALTSNPDAAAEFERAGFTQDPDVLDTWFSSWLWPFATMGWPEPTDTLKKFYPTTDLVTGPDIIFFWVARMIMAGYEYMGEAGSALPKKFDLPDAMPFQNVYFTGIIRDKQGRKMSKSLGNSPDPLDLIAKFGADALRFGVMRAAPLGQDILFDEQNVELGRNFCNKLWNACRFRQMVGQSSAGVSPAPGEENQPEGRRDACPTFEVQGEIEPTLLSSDDKWILLKLDAAIREVTIALNEYKFSDATVALYRFFWSEYCDWYVEASKAVLGSARVPRADSGVSPESSEASGATPDAATETVALPENFAARKSNTLAVIDFVLSHTLRLFHPFLPFITEELWHGMGYATDMPENQGGKTIMFAPWPMPLDEEFKKHYGLDSPSEEKTSARYFFIAQIRHKRTEHNIPSNKRIRLVYHHLNHGLPDSEWAVVQLLAGIEKIDFVSNYHPVNGEPVIYPPFGGKLFMPLEGLIDVAAEKLRLQKEVEKNEAEIGKVESKLNNPAFAQKVPPQVLEEHRQRLVEWQNKLSHAKAALDTLQG
jgi:valyl-tRNA synthetase